MVTLKSGPGHSEGEWRERSPRWSRTVKPGLRTRRGGVWPCPQSSEQLVPEGSAAGGDRRPVLWQEDLAGGRGTARGPMTRHCDLLAVGGGQGGPHPVPGAVVSATVLQKVALCGPGPCPR